MEDVRFVVMGAGAWGTAMAIHLSPLGRPVYLVPRNAEKAKIIREKHENIYHLPRIPLPENLTIESQLELCLDAPSTVFLACPTQGLVAMSEQLRPFEKNIKSVVSLVKGLDHKTLKTPSELVRSILTNVDIACLSGPTYANEFAQGKPAAMVLAAHYEVQALQEKMSSAQVRIYRTQDLRGVELASCLKNIYALGAGILDGLDLGDNAKAAYLTRALSEMTRLGVHLGGQKETFYGLSGLGDLIATAQGSWSRNRNFGEAFARGASVQTLLEGKTVEGYWSIQCFTQLMQNTNVELPILKNLHAVLYEHQPLRPVVSELLLRKLKKEV